MVLPPKKLLLNLLLDIWHCWRHPSCRRPSQPAGLGQVTAKLTSRVVGADSDVVGVRPPGEHHPQALGTGGHELDGQLLGGAVAGVVMVVGG